MMCSTFLAAGASHDEVLASYSYLEPADLVAVLEFAAKQSDHPVPRSAYCASS